MKLEPLEPQGGTSGPALEPDALERRVRRLTWAITLGVLALLVGFLLLSRPPGAGRPEDAPTASQVQVLPGGTIRLPGAGPFVEKLRPATVHTRSSSAPLVEASGSVLAALSAGGPRSPVRCQFATPELLSNHSELLQAEADLVFQNRQLGNTRALNEAKVRTQTRVVERLRGLVQVGSDSPRDLAAEEAALQERHLEGDRALHEAEGATKAAERKVAALTRQLEQAGLSPELLRLHPGDPGGRAMLVAEIPESRMGQVKEGQSCTVRFLGRSDPGGASLSGKVASILPTVAPGQRTLRVAIVLPDPRESLRPGMFASVGLGTDPRQVLIVPATALLHVGRADYVLVSRGRELTISEVTLGDGQGPEVEVLSGLESGATIIGDGALLLKPAVVQSLSAGGLRR